MGFSGHLFTCWKSSVMDYFASENKFSGLKFRRIQNKYKEISLQKAQQGLFLLNEIQILNF